MPGTFLEFLLISVAAALFLIGAFLLRRRWTARPTRLRLLLEGESRRIAGVEEILLPLLVYEDDFPSFTEIMGLVLETFPLSRFLGNAQFREALTFLDKAVYDNGGAIHLRAAMCQVVRVFLEDPDVEYHCRPHLSRLVDSFLEELESFEGQTAR